MFCAHINPQTLKEQSVKEHLENVAEMAMEYAAKGSLSATGKLIGILHDMGKETNVFNNYIHYCSKNPGDKSLRGMVDHSTAGAKYIYDNFYDTKDQFQKLTAQIISLVICSHHGGLIDCLDLGGIDKLKDRMTKDKEFYYDEALTNFMSDYSNLENINDLFNEATEEIKALLAKIKQIDETTKFGRFATGMLVKYIFSCVIDADRFDTYTFMQEKVEKRDVDKSDLWSELLDVLENKLKGYPKLSKIDLLREEISLLCKSFGGNEPGTYQLSVPTGGGKTLSSLRYALTHAKKYKKDRIFYIIPFTTIIDQNAKEIKDILGHEDLILEHHSNLVIDYSQGEENDDNYNAKEAYKLLTERWNSPIIFTTMVQFLNTLFSGGTQNVRRMHNLANSVIIFDEIQAIPIKCINMFNSAINFLSSICNATIILCTATQPLLDTTEMPLKLSENANIISNANEKFKQFKRVNLIDKRIVGGYSAVLLKDFIIDKMDKVKSLLVILNTKKMTMEVFGKLNKANRELPKEKQCLIFHLSTGMCPSHRISVLEGIKEKLGNERVICVSTQLIEAGVNISFECVVRSLAGLDNIAQAAGRCNRHGEKAYSEAYIVNIEQENIRELVDIKEGQECTRRVLDEFKESPNIFDNDLLSQKAMDRYYKYYFYNRKTAMNYTLPKENRDKSMYDILSGNNKADNAFCGKNGYKSNLMLKQAFKTAGNEFCAIDQYTTGIIVPYKEGEKLITLINSECSLDELKQYLKKAQQFSVNLFETDRKKLEKLGGLIMLKNNVAFALRKEFYREDVGVTFEEVPMDFLNF